MPSLAIQICLAMPSLDKITPTPQDKTSRLPNRRFDFHKRSQPLIGAHNKALTVAMRVNSEDRSAVKSNR